ncbi:hypothetical protein PO909_003925 [Leuciscus waleckii]
MYEVARRYTRGVSDHKLIECCFHMITPPPSSEKTTITCRNIRPINHSMFSASIEASPLLDLDELSSADDLVATYNGTLTSLLDSLAPVRTRLVPANRTCPWFTPELRKLKATGRRLERLYKKTGLTIHSMLYTEHTLTYRDALNAACANYYSSLITSSMSRPKTLFRTVDKLHKPPVTACPKTPEQCQAFLQFFDDKISQIYHCFNPNAISLSSSTPSLGPQLSHFNAIDSLTITDIINKSNSSSCQLDPAPTPLLKACNTSLSKPIALIVNTCLNSGVVPAALKTAAVTPILKKTDCDPTSLLNYRPISNLPFLAKVMERVVASQLHTFLNHHDLYESFQSGFRSCHSTETALLRIVNDLLLSADSGSLNILILLDLSAAFDTINHNVLIARLSAIGVSGTALTWFQSYLSNRKQFVTLGPHQSSKSPVTRGVPQGSVLGPLLFLIYILPIGQIIRSHGLNFHCYADDIQLYLTTPSPSDPPPCSLTDCLSDLKLWMQNNFLKLNTDKTEILLIGPKSILSKSPSLTLNIDGSPVHSTPVVKNLGILLDSSLSFDPHIRSLTKTAFFHLRNIARLQPFLSVSDAQILVNSFIMSRLDYCNSLFLGLPAKSLQRLQYIQNSAARLLTHTRRSAHITPILHQLHLLPVPSRIKYKVLLLTFKALHNLAPPYIRDLLTPYTPSRSLRSSDQNLLAIPRSRLCTLGGRSFSALAPKLWNRLPQPLRDCPSLPFFKAHLKTFLFNDHFSTPNS